MKIYKAKITQDALLAIAHHWAIITPTLLDRAESIAIERAESNGKNPLILASDVEQAIESLPLRKVYEVSYAACPGCQIPQDIVEFVDEPISCCWCGHKYPVSEWKNAL